MYKLSSEEQSLLERFEAAYNRIDRELRERTDLDGTFSSILYRYEERTRSWRDGEELKRLSRLRNVIVHDKVAAYRYAAIPTPEVVDRIEAIYQRLTSPETAYSESRQNEVVKISTDTTVEAVLGLIHKHDFSQFPVYEQNRFAGLLTENGITRWLSRYVQDHEPLIELGDVRVRGLLETEQKRSNYVFVGRNETLDEVIYLFEKNPLLEAALITETGKEHQALLGIVTRWDMIGVQED